MMKLSYVWFILLVKKIFTESGKKLILLSFLILLIPNLSDAKDTIKLVTHSPVNNAKPYKDCGTEICTSLLKLISNANKTVDFAIYGMRYSFREKNIIFKALIDAGKRGVKVRGVTDKSLRQKNYYTDENLVGKNLKFVHDDYKSDHSDGIMHNKFFIVDKKYVWTGSANISDGGVGGYDANIAAYINSPYLAKYYTLEFEQMFVENN